MDLEGFTDFSAILRAGIYILVRKGEIVYIGQSRSLYSRIYTHKLNNKKVRKGFKLPAWLQGKGFSFDEVYVRPCEMTELDRLEKEMIQLHQPRYNVKHNGKKPTKIVYDREPISLNINGTVITLNAKPEPIARRI